MRIRLKPLQRALAKTLCGFHDVYLMDAIIDLLQKNALMPRDEMARLLNMTTAEVEAAIAKLEADGIILGYQPVLNREKWDTDKVTAVIEVKITTERDGGFDRINVWRTEDGWHYSGPTGAAPADVRRGGRGPCWAGPIDAEHAAKLLQRLQNMERRVDITTREVDA